jgi:hypothetical protein
VLSDDFVGRVSLDPFGASIPINDQTVGIEQVKSVIGDALDQRAELPRGFAQCLLGDLPLGDVAGDFCEADQLLVLVADGVDLHRGPEAPAILAQPPAFSLVVAIARCGFEDARRQARHAVITRVEF